MSKGRFSAVVALLFMLLVWTAHVSTQTPAPASPPAAAAPAQNGPVMGAAFVGAETCGGCHREVFDTWKSGRHSKMLQPATRSTVLGDFDVARITLHDRPYSLRLDDKNQYFITESYLTGREQEHRIEYTLGSRRIQHYITTDAQGRMVILPPTWDVTRRQWFDNMEIVRPDQDEKTLVQQWNKNCFGCHVSQQDNNYKPAEQTYATKWVDFGTSCERCHGPGSLHVEAYSRTKDPALVTARTIVRPTKLDPQTSSMICAQCHTFRDIVAPGFTAGSNYADYFLPFLEYAPQKEDDPAYWADGRPRRFSNDAMGLWQSECFLRGGATCTTCHRDPHLPDVDRNAQLAASNNTLCVRCHQEIGAKLTSHTRHAPTSAGSSCVECHMPKTVVALKATMRDHTMSLPTPENTVAFKIPNACTECHADKPAQWAVDTLKNWFPENRRAKIVARAEAFTAGRAGKPEMLERLIAMTADETEGPFIQANAAGYLANYPEERAVTALLTAAKAAHPALRSAAMSSLGRIDTASSRAALLDGLDDPVRSVRIPALTALINRGYRPTTGLDVSRVRRVSEEFADRAALHEDDANVQRDLGLVRLLTGDYDRSAEALVNSLGLDPKGPSGKFLLALARVGQKRTADARQLLLQVPPDDPSYHAAQESLKKLPPSP
jgi:predicted CXXCH cytochrome family protein